MTGGRKGMWLRYALATLLLVLAAVLTGCGGSEPSSESSTSPPTTPVTQAATSAGSEGSARSADESADCDPTPPDMLGPYYEPDAPVRTSVGSGHVLSGAVLAAGSCEPIPDARIEFCGSTPGSQPRPEPERHRNLLDERAQVV